MCISIHMQAYPCMCMIFMHMHAYPCMCTDRYACICMHTHAHACRCVHMRRATNGPKCMKLRGPSSAGPGCSPEGDDGNRIDEVFSPPPQNAKIPQFQRVYNYIRVYLRMYINKYTYICT